MCLKTLAASVLVVLLATSGTAAAQTAIPVPDDDPFYAAPAHLKRVPNGGILKSREVTITGYGTPIPGVRTWQVQFRSNDGRGRPIAAVTTLMVPTDGYVLGAPRPLVSYQMAIDSLGTRCNPSYTVRTGTQKELATLYPLLRLGYAVVTTDFEGPRMALTAGLIAARTVLDGIKAAEALPATGLAGPQTPVALFGYSGGAQASVWAAEQQPAYAPALNVKAVAAGGVPADLELLARQIDGSPYAGLLFLGSFGLEREHPELDLDRYLNDAGRQLRETLKDACVEDAFAAYPFQHFSDYTTVADPIGLPAAQRVLAANRMGKATPTAPLYLFHSIADQIVPISGTDALVVKYCAGGATLFYNRETTGEHVSYALTGSPAAYAYIAARFAGIAPPTNC